MLETPQANLVAGMKWLLGVYPKRFNLHHQLCGHLFAGRYIALRVDGLLGESGLPGDTAAGRKEFAQAETITKQRV